VKKFIIAIAALSPALSYAQEAVEHAAAHAEGGGPLEINVGLQVWVIATFVVMMGLLAKLAFKPIGEALERRGSTIKAQLDEAEKSRADAKKLMEDYQKQIAEARAEAAKVIEEARLLGEKVRKDVVDKANAEASAVVSRAQEEIIRQKEKGIQEMKDTVASLAVQIAGKVIEKEVTEATHKVLVENLIKDLAKVRK
jgi:F-type H+-transporting ATPase subunit b